MKYTAILLSATLGLFIFMACGEGNKSDVRKDARQSLDVQERNVPISENPPTLPPQPPANTSAAAANGVSHYICPNNCAGSGGDGQGTCPVCGTAYVHNTAFHNQTAQPNTTTTTATSTPQQPANTGAAQNAAGVFHYTCPNGCAGGAAAAGACATCGTALAHNTAFHNN